MKLTIMPLVSSITTLSCSPQRKHGFNITRTLSPKQGHYKEGWGGLIKASPLFPEGTL